MKEHAKTIGDSQSLGEYEVGNESKKMRLF